MKCVLTQVLIFLKKCTCKRKRCMEPLVTSLSSRPITIPINVQYYHVHSLPSIGSYLYYEALYFTVRNQQLHQLAIVLQSKTLIMSFNLKFKLQTSPTFTSAHFGPTVAPPVAASQAPRRLHFLVQSAESNRASSI